MALVQERAEQRSSVIQKGSVSYNFHICLEKGDLFSGYAELIFDLVKVPEELVIDYKGNEATKIIQNGEVIETKIVDGFIHLDVGKLKVGNNIVGVHYKSSYNNDGSGCVSFVDVDNKQYIYTQFEPYFANRVFPCFDQPNLKAKMNLFVISPAEWKKVLSN